MIVAAHQPHYLPWLGYLDKIAKADVFVIMDDLQFEAQNFQNRQRLKLCNGAGWLTVPVHRGSQSDRIDEKQIDNCRNVRQHWQHRHWRTIVTHYGSAKHFGDYRDELEDVYKRPWRSLLELDLHMLGLAMKWLDIRTPLVRSSELKLVGQKTDRLIDMCHKLGARCYLTGSGGSQSYLDAEKIGRSGVGVIWQVFKHPRYEQRYPNAGFASHLGFLDLLLNHGPDSHAILFDHAHPVDLPRLASMAEHEHVQEAA